VVKFGVEEALFLVTRRRTRCWTYTFDHYETGADSTKGSDRMLVKHCSSFVVADVMVFWHVE
jgi:hypothetical protein